MTSKNALVRCPKDPLPPWRDFAELPLRCEDIVLSSDSTTPVILVSLSALAHSILWRPLDEGITLVELFGGIGSRWASVLEAGLTV